MITGLHFLTICNFSFQIANARRFRERRIVSCSFPPLTLKSAA